MFISHESKRNIFSKNVDKFSFDGYRIFAKKKISPHQKLLPQIIVVGIIMPLPHFFLSVGAVCLLLPYSFYLTSSQK